MPRFTTAALVLATAALTQAQETYTYSGQPYTVTQDTGGDIPLASKHFQYPYLPYKADSGDGPRGTQQGYNICNSTTLGDTSMCQTGMINSVDDFCLWGSPIANETVADTEEEMVAYCTTPKYGTRVLPAGALQGVQFIKTPDYVEVVGFIDQTALDLQIGDYGGEEDPHGADQRGNPLGSLLYSSAFGNGSASPYQQVIEWSYFVGGGVFCFKACDPAGKNAASLCQHTYDRVGCAYNAPASYATINGTFQSCQGDDQLPVGIFVENGVTSTYYQPAESLGAITTIPYTASIPATSSCSTYSSASLYSLLSSSSTAVSSASAGPTAAPASSAAVSAAGSRAKSSSVDSSSSASAISASIVLALTGAMGAAVALLA